MRVDIHSPKETKKSLARGVNSFIIAMPFSNCASSSNKPSVKRKTDLSFIYFKRLKGEGQASHKCTNIQKKLKPGVSNSV